MRVAFIHMIVVVCVCVSSYLSLLHNAKLHEVNCFATDMCLGKCTITVIKLI